MKNHTTKLGALLMVAALCVPAVLAQQKGKDPRVRPTEPLAPIGAEESSSAASGQPAGDAAARQARTPLTGAENWSPGSSGAGRSFLLPSLSLYAGGDTNPRGFQTNDELSAVTTVGGRLAFQHVWQSSELTAEYAGGGTFYSAVADNNRTYQDLKLAYKKFGRRWSLLVADHVSYSPEGGAGGGFGFGQLGPGPGSISGTPLVNLNPALRPNQSVVTTDTPRISNTVTGEFEFSPGRRSSITVSGSYGILRFLESGFIDGDTLSFSSGYNHTLTARDTLAFSYGANLFRYQGIDQENLSHSAQIIYGRQVTGRLSFQIGAGPQITIADAAGGTTNQLVSWTMQSSLRYRWNRADANLSYHHGVTGGSGFFLGSETDQVRASVSRQLSRLWRGGVNFDFARNKSLAETLAGTAGRRYNTWGGGFQLSRPVGRYTRMYFNYQAQRQKSTNVACTGPTCAFEGTRHVFGLGFNFRFKTVELD